MIIGYEIFLYVNEGLLLALTIVLCQMTKHVPGRLSEAKKNLKGATQSI